ncbi:hypothetical protein ACH3XW_45060 [Acanthocheilonema viteae]
MAKVMVTEAPLLCHHGRPTVTPGDHHFSYTAADRLVYSPISGIRSIPESQVSIYGTILDERKSPLDPQHL